MTNRNEFCWCGSGKKFKKCHYPQENPNALAAAYRKHHGIILKTPEQIAGIRKACEATARILEALCKHAKEGVTTQELDDLCMQLHREAGYIPAPLNYGEPPYPKSICTSLNDVICHGIPSSEKLKKGDILNIDCSTIVDGYFGDCSKMVCIGEVSADAQRVVDTSYECLMKAIAICKPGVLVSQIGDVISDHAESRGCSVVHQFIAHGIGLEFHEEPQIMHCRNDCDIPLAAGMTFTIEPMINLGVPEAVIDRRDGWTARTKDGKLSAQWEHTICITPDGCELLTNWKR